MNKLKLLIVEGNTKEENVNFGNAGCVPQSQNFKKHLQKIEPNSEIDIVEPIDDNSISKIISSLKSSFKRKVLPVKTTPSYFFKDEIIFEIESSSIGSTISISLFGSIF